ncbi:MFS transporter [Saliterribacillus persicus]|uniref:Putative MFS family arabinose efflux permease n=1 Tax=Saliterribacillus persicus TaxID=930114 RepID=A0A368X999_9BACI|nr:MFS transporter [Saliterribacillus persicus]RCW64533.1 putative MFS family arabinose efflux permease [Saliterribacillus persicus]
MSGFKNILIAFFLAEFGRAMYFVTVTWVLYELTNDPLYTGLLIGLGFFPGLVLNLFFGVIVDRFNRKKISILANIISTFSMAILLFFFIIDKIEPWLIVLVHMILQVSGSLFRPAIQAFIAENFDKNHLPKIFSQSSSSAIVGGLLGASIGGIIISILSVSGSMSIVTGSFAIASISLFLIKSEIREKQKVSNKNSIIKDITDGFTYIRSHKFLLGLFIIMFNGQLVFHTSLGFLSVYTVEYLLQSATVYGLLDASISIGGILAGLIGTWWWRIGKNKIALYSLLVVLVGLLFVGIAPILPVSFVGVILIGLGTTWIRVLLQAVQQIATNSEYHGRMASYRMIGNQGSVVISAPILGFVATNYGANYIYLSLMIPISLCIIFALFQANEEQFMKITKKIA